MNELENGVNNCIITTGDDIDPSPWTDADHERFKVAMERVKELERGESIQETNLGFEARLAAIIQRYDDRLLVLISEELDKHLLKNLPAQADEHFHLVVPTQLVGFKFELAAPKTHGTHRQFIKRNKRKNFKLK